MIRTVNATWEEMFFGAERAEMYDDEEPPMDVCPRFYNRKCDTADTNVCEQWDDIPF